jgi:hypothetical protein
MGKHGHPSNNKMKKWKPITVSCQQEEVEKRWTLINLEKRSKRRTAINRPDPHLGERIALNN